MNESITAAYATYGRPKLASLLQAIRLDKVYHRAEGDHLYYRNERGDEIRVTDFLGGYGASLFGHHHPSLVRVAEHYLQNKKPFNVQGSCPNESAVLCETLDRMLHERTGRHYVTTLASTGSEAVEAAVKHALLVYRRRVEKLGATLEKRLDEVRSAIEDGRATLSPEVRRRICGMPVSEDSFADSDNVFSLLTRHNERVLAHPPSFLSLKGAYHGTTCAAARLTDREDYQTMLSPSPHAATFVEPNDRSDLANAVEASRRTLYRLEIGPGKQLGLVEDRPSSIAGFFIEPIQGEGGMRQMDVDYLQYCRQVADDNGFPLIFDEIQSGMGRTGRFLASEGQSVAADYYLLSKSLGGGLAKISALIVARDHYADAFGMLHNSTFAEDDYSASVALSALSLLAGETGVIQKCAWKGNHLRSELSALQRDYPDVIEAVRGRGLMLGVTFRKPERCGSSTFKALFGQDLMGFVVMGYLLHEHGLRVAPALLDNATIRLEPSAYIGRSACERLTSALRRLCEILRKENVYHLTRFIVEAEKPGSLDGVDDCRRVPVPDPPAVERSVAFLGHFIEAKDMRLFDAGLSRFTAEQLERYLEKVYTIVEPQVFDQITVRSPRGGTVGLNVIGMLVDSRVVHRHLTERDPAPIREKIEGSLQLAADRGCSTIGLGATARSSLGTEPSSPAKRLE